MGDGKATTRAAAPRVTARRSTRWGWWRKPVLTDTDGKFELKELSKGTYTVRVYRRGGGESFAEGVALGSNITVTIKATGSIAGTVRVSGGSAPDEMRISITDR